jgi:hypothetical protein
MPIRDRIEIDGRHRSVEDVRLAALLKCLEFQLFDVHGDSDLGDGLLHPRRDAVGDPLRPRGNQHREHERRPGSLADAPVGGHVPARFIEQSSALRRIEGPRRNRGVGPRGLRGVTRNARAGEARGNRRGESLAVEREDHRASHSRIMEVRNRAILIPVDFPTAETVEVERSEARGGGSLTRGEPEIGGHTEQIEITDAIYLLSFLFQGGPELPAPYPVPGPDPTGDDPYDCGGPI